MTPRLQAFWQGLRGQQADEATRDEVTRAEESPQLAPPIAIAPNDPLLLYLQNTAGVVDVASLAMESPSLRAMRAAGIRLALPLVSQGELIGLISLGPRLSEQDYSGDDRRLLNDLATQAAPAVRVAQLARQQQVEARERERLQQELKVARLIQQTLLPKEVPQPQGWQMAAYYEPARAVGGDFYDFIELDEGQLAIIVGDVTDKGVPAALVMATTRAILRGASQRFASPGAVLERANDLLHPDIPPKMFVTCLYAILDPHTGRLRYANAGHDLPYRRTATGMEELRARGMPLGLMPGMHYEEKELMLQPGESVLFYSDGLVEAHDPQREMFGFPRLQALMREHAGGAALIPFLLDQLDRFTGEGWEQEDDVTLVTVQRERAPQDRAGGGEGAQSEPRTIWHSLATFSLPSEPGNERAAMERVAAVVRAAPWPLHDARLERLKTAVAEATMNAMEHGNQYDPRKATTIEVRGSAASFVVRVTDEGGSSPAAASDTPDLEAKLAGVQSPRGWGLFLIEKMVDEMHIHRDGAEHTIELILYREPS